MNESGFSAVDQAVAPDEYIQRLDQTGAVQFWRTVKQRTYSLLDLQPGKVALDLGCGTGDDVREMARRVIPGGEVMGIDSSRTMITEARQRSQDLDLSIHFRLGDAHSLDIPDASFDACRAERVFQHLKEPQAAFREFVRVARPAARLVVVEPDYGTTQIKGADPALSKTIIASRSSHFRAGHVGRELPRFFREAELVNLSVTIFTASSAPCIDENEQALLLKHVAAATASGAISMQEGSQWLDDLQAAGVAGEYHRSTLIFMVSGQKSH